MPSININEIDNTLVSRVNSNANTVLVFGTSTFGPTAPTLISTSAELRQFGGNTEDSITYDYLTNLVNNRGTSVLFKRFVSNSDVASSVNILHTMSNPGSNWESLGNVSLGDTGYVLYLNAVDLNNPPNASGVNSVVYSEASGNLIITFNRNVELQKYECRKSVGDEAMSPTLATFSGNQVTIPISSFGEAIQEGVRLVFTSNYAGYSYESTVSSLMNIQNSYISFGGTAIDSLSSMTFTYSDSTTLSLGDEGMPTVEEFKSDVENRYLYKYLLNGTAVLSSMTAAVSGLNPVVTVSFTYGSLPSNQNGYISFLKYLPTTGVSDLNIVSKYKGSYGNNLRLDFSRTPITGNIYDYYAQLYVNGTVVETYRLGEYDLSTETYNAELLNALTNVLIESIYIEIDPNVVATTFDFNSPDFVNNTVSYTLAGGADSDYDTYLGIISEALANYGDDIANLEDKYAYDFKFITSGGYASKTIFDGLKRLAVARKDCVVIGDTTNTTDYVTACNEFPIDSFLNSNDSYAAVYFPWCYVTLSSGNKWVAPSYLVLDNIFANVQAGGNIYDPPAGVNRGLTAVIKPACEIGGVALDVLQSNNATHICINPIMKIRGYGYTIYGIRTAYALKPPYSTDITIESALQQINVRIVANEIKHKIFDTCLSLTFENNNLLTWNSFVAQIQPLLNSMVSAGVLSDFAIIPSDLTRYSSFTGTIKVAMIEAVEDFDINFEIYPSTVTFNENGDTVEL